MTKNMFILNIRIIDVLLVEELDETYSLLIVVVVVVFLMQLEKYVMVHKTVDLMPIKED